MKLLELQQFILACPMCMSGSGADGKAAQAANSAILVLFVVLCGVLMTFVSFIVYLAKRARLAAMEEALETSPALLRPPGEATNSRETR